MYLSAHLYKHINKQLTYTFTNMFYNISKITVDYKSDIKLV